MFQAALRRPRQQLKLQMSIPVQPQAELLNELFSDVMWCHN